MSILVVSGLVAASCSPSVAETTVTTLPTTDHNAAARPPASSSTTTTTEPVISVRVEGELPDELLAAVASLLSWQIDDRNQPPEIPEGLRGSPR